MKTRLPKLVLKTLTQIRFDLGQDPTEAQLRSAQETLTSTIELIGGCDHSGAQGHGLCCCPLIDTLEDILRRLNHET